MRGATFLIVLAIVTAGCASGARVEEPAPVPPAAAPLPSAPEPPVIVDPILVCVVVDGRMEDVAVEYDTRTGDTTVAGRPFSEVYPLADGYAANAAWYVENEPIVFTRGRRHVKYGLPRVLGRSDLTPVGEYRGVSVFAEAGAAEPYRVLYVLTRPGCEFQPYMDTADYGAVRGG
jgi:hypothetical protein